MKNLLVQRLMQAGIALATLAFVPTIAFAAPATAAQLLAAKSSAERGDDRPLQQLREGLKDQLMEPYVEFWLLTGRTSRADAAMAASIKDYLARFAGQPTAEALRKEWLLTLARRADWATFREFFTPENKADSDLNCLDWQEKLARNEPVAAQQALDEARAVWASPRETPAQCQAAWSAVNSREALTRATSEARFRTLLGGGAMREARFVASLIGNNAAVIDRAQAESAKYLDRESGAAGTHEATLLAIAKLASSNADAAFSRAKAALSLSAADRAFAMALAGREASGKQSDEALGYFKAALAVSDAPVPGEQVNAWRVRAALRAQDWPLVSKFVSAMPNAQRAETTWRYWFARALAEQGKPIEAQAFYKEIATDPTFYGLLAAEQAQIATAPAWQPTLLSAAELDRARARPGLQRAIALYQMGLRDDGFREWSGTVRGLPDRDLLAASQVARAANIPDRAINTAERTKELIDYAERYPTHHLVEAKAAAARENIELQWVYSIIRQESRFMHDVRSRAGAVGLMQLMPATAKWVADKNGIKGFNSSQLVDVEMNLRLGSYYLKQVYQDLGHRVMAIAAYNAGPGRAKAWRADQPLEGAIYAETIPFNETRDYVKKVLANQFYYEHRLTGKAPSLKALLGTIPGKSARLGTQTAATNPSGVAP